VGGCHDKYQKDGDGNSDDNQHMEMAVVAAEVDMVLACRHIMCFSLPAVGYMAKKTKPYSRR
jgi:hypothetical protein